ncbi:hypothetical protein [Aeromonas sp. 1805]|uniref:hypothetical protein n=1 Tax=Aeromonas sp. 1805 TaxID=2560028 RepID=UPI00209BD0C9|nr:hypothetical protein [Aeromonas sp. 1805]
MSNARKGDVGWLAKSKMEAGLAAEPSIPVEFKEDAPVVNRSANPIPVQAGEIIGHWGEHELATWISESFINKRWSPKNTLYKMRWNPAAPVTSQYATDINWALAQKK